MLGLELEALPAKQKHPKDCEALHSDSPAFKKFISSQSKKAGSNTVGQHNDCNATNVEQLTWKRDVGMMGSFRVPVNSCQASTMFSGDLSPLTPSAHLTAPADGTSTCSNFNCWLSVCLRCNCLPGVPYVLREPSPH